ncbi:hypothetical protein [Haloarcula litorea]|uniref:DUF5789 family protein n=1 Tax=Haloarcula litorea TaxID=3032579 RepID=UPI0023E7EC08|nr:hypothetical protein [Halomicroarcula sp. GDY20]
MALQPAEARELFAQECSFPMDREAIIEAVGNVAIESPNGEASDFETVLTRGDETAYASVTELHSTVMANLEDDHIGRKHYDDRSDTVLRETELSL